MADASKRRAKHQDIYERLRREIADGVYLPGQRIPSEHELAALFGASRPTVGRAIGQLEQDGLVTRRRGSGTYVSHHQSLGGLRLGILAPGVEMDTPSLFGSMVARMADLAGSRNHLLLMLGKAGEDVAGLINHTWRMCHELIDVRADGVFFMPFEVTEDTAEVNQDIARAFTDAGIPVTLLDRDITPGHRRSAYDLVSVDHVQASFMLTEHLIKLGWRRIDFVAGAFESSAVSQRISGYQDALRRHGITIDSSRVHRVDVLSGGYDRAEERVQLVRQWVDGGAEALMCVNDRIAASLMHAALSVPLRIPEDIRITGFDDLPLLAYLPVALTTVRQPAEALAREAVRTLVDRLREPRQAARNVVIRTELVVRHSCGADWVATRGGG